MPLVMNLLKRKAEDISGDVVNFPLGWDVADMELLLSSQSSEMKLWRMVRKMYGIDAFDLLPSDEVCDMTSPWDEPKVKHPHTGEVIPNTNWNGKFPQKLITLLCCPVFKESRGLAIFRHVVKLAKYYRQMKGKELDGVNIALQQKPSMEAGPNPPHFEFVHKLKEAAYLRRYKQRGTVTNDIIFVDLENIEIAWEIYVEEKADLFTLKYYQKKLSREERGMDHLESLWWKRDAILRKRFATRGVIVPAPLPSRDQSVIVPAHSVSRTEVTVVIPLLSQDQSVIVLAAAQPEEFIVHAAAQPEEVIDYAAAQPEEVIDYAAAQPEEVIDYAAAQPEEVIDYAAAQPEEVIDYAAAQPEEVIDYAAAQPEEVIDYAAAQPEEFIVHAAAQPEEVIVAIPSQDQSVIVPDLSVAQDVIVLSSSSFQGSQMDLELYASQDSQDSNLQDSQTDFELLRDTQGSYTDVDLYDDTQDDIGVELYGGDTPGSYPTTPQFIEVQDANSKDLIEDDEGVVVNDEQHVILQVEFEEVGVAQEGGGEKEEEEEEEEEEIVIAGQVPKPISQRLADFLAMDLSYFKQL
ncbi:hypothetical protein NHQ30_005162 [Ciborinia camelliae]|nr:hypothetical protein NHQ30_005162 [Ciborinia camelliae]